MQVRYIPLTHVSNTWGYNQFMTLYMYPHLVEGSLCGVNAMLKLDFFPVL
jgi:hypothetical protein